MSANDTNGKLLVNAYSLINGDRMREYGNPQQGFICIATMWTAYLNKKISPHDVACMMALLKLAREAHKHKEDNLLDAAGYIGLAADLADTARDMCCYENNR